MNKPKSRIMQDGFEKDIQKRMQDFNLEPSPQVWNEIDTALSEKKRRRFILWWWLLPLMLAGGGVVWFYHAGYKSNIPSVVSNQKEKVEGNENQSIRNKNKNEGIQEEGYAKNQDAIPDSKQVRSYQKDDLGPGKSAVTNTNRDKENTTGRSSIEAAKIAGLSEIVQQNDTGINPADKKTDSSKGEPSLSSGKKDSSAVQLLFKDSANKLVQKTKNKISNNKRGNWLITVGAGITSTKESGSNNLLDPDKSLTQLNGADNGSGNYSSSPDSTDKIIGPDNGFHFTAGIVYQYSLSKKWTISSGLQYRFLTNKQRVGKFTDSSSGNSSSLNYVSQYYQAGYKNNITNKAHWLEVPLNIVFNINPASKTKMQLSAGASYAWMFAAKWLIPDSRSNKLYYSKQLLNKNILNWQAGTAVTFSSGWIIGLQYQQSFSTLANKSVEPHLYWQNFSFYSAFPFKIKNHKP